MNMENILKLDKETLQKFTQMMKDDENIAKKVQEIGANNWEGLLAYAKELGLNLPENALEELKTMAAQLPQELSENDMNDIAGGVCRMIERMFV